VELGCVVPPLALVQRCPDDVFLEGEIRAFIGQYLKVDIDSVDAHSHLADDFGLDLFEITELLMALEERFGIEPEITDEANQIQFVHDLIRYIESSKHGLDVAGGSIPDIA
jgi:acyl carrier protein